MISPKPTTAYDVLVHRSRIPVTVEPSPVAEPWPVRALRRMIARLTAHSYAGVVRSIFIGGDLPGHKGRTVDPSVTTVAAVLKTDGTHAMTIAPFEGRIVLIRAMAKDVFVVSSHRRSKTIGETTVDRAGLRTAVSAMIAA